MGNSNEIEFFVFSGKYPFKKLGRIKAEDANAAITKVKGNWHQWREVRPAVRSVDGSYEAGVEANAYAPEEDGEHLV